MNSNERYRASDDGQQVTGVGHAVAAEGISNQAGGQNSTLVEQSIAWIRRFPNASNHDVPAELRDAWILPNNPSADERKAALVIFLAGHTIAKARAADTQVEKVTVSAAEVSEQFENWQLKLVLAKLSAGTGPRSSPLPLFSVNADEEVRVTI